MLDLSREFVEIHGFSLESYGLRYHNDSPANLPLENIKRVGIEFQDYVRPSRDRYRWE